MESTNRNVWIFVAIVLVVFCCCALAGAAAVAGWFLGQPLERGGGTDFGLGQERIEQTFAVGESPNLEVDNFAGSLTVQAGGYDEIRVVAVKRASGGRTLDRIKVQFYERDGDLAIKTEKPSSLSNASVNFEITVPRDIHLDLHTGAGSVEVRGIENNVVVDSGAGSLTISDVRGQVEADTGAGSVTIRDVRGEIEARSGSGSIEIRGASGRVQLDTGSGSIQYEGSPQDDCHFETGAGSITLWLPADLDMEVDLDTGLGSIEMDYVVDGLVTKQEVRGVIGSGEEGEIYAHTGTGGIDLVRR